MTKLSICIPSRNMAHLIGQTLESIKYEVPFINHNELEIVILDNCSEDTTANTIQEWQTNNPSLNINYYKTAELLPISHMIASICDYAKGSYIWIIGDDLVEKTAIRKIIEIIDKYSPSFIALKVNWYDNSLSNFHHDIKTNNEFLVSPNVSLLHFSFFGFIGGLVFKSQLSKEMHKHLDNFYPHCYIVYGNLHSNFVIDYTISFVKARANQDYRFVPMRLIKTVFDGIKVITDNEKNFTSKKELNSYLRKEFKNPYQMIFPIIRNLKKGKKSVLKYYWEHAEYKKYRYLLKIAFYCTPGYFFYPICFILNIFKAIEKTIKGLCSFFPYKIIRTWIKETRFLKSLTATQVDKQLEIEYKASSTELLSLK